MTAETTAQKTDISYLIKSTLYPLAYFFAFFLPIGIQIIFGKQLFDGIFIGIVVISPICYLLVGWAHGKKYLKQNIAFLTVAIALNIFLMPENEPDVYYSFADNWAMLITLCYGLSFIVYFWSNFSNNRRIKKILKEPESAKNPDKPTD